MSGQMSHRAVVALAALLVGSVALALRAQEPPGASTPERAARFELRGSGQKDAQVFDSATGRLYAIDDLEVVHTVDPVAGTVTVRALRCPEREAAVRAVVAAIREKNAAALRPRMTRANLARHADVESWVLELEADLGQAGLDAWLRKARFRFEDEAWRLDL